MFHNAGELRWIRRILNIYWSVILIHLLAQCAVILFLEPLFGGMYFVVRNILVPTLTMSAATWVSEELYRRNSRWLRWYLPASGAFLSATAVYVSFDVRVIPATFLLSIVTSIIFFNRSVIWYSAAVHLVGYLLVLAFGSRFRSQLLGYDILTFLCLLAATTLVTLGIAARGKEILAELERSFRSEQELARHREREALLARTDFLTQLRNRTAFEEELERALTVERPILQLALLDIDNFKSINDTYGHVVGDGVLARVASVLRECCGTEAVACRFGGEEFAVIGREPDPERARERMERIREGIARLPMPEMPGRPVTVSAGVAAWAPGQSKEALLAEADRLLYEAKRSGKNRVVARLV